MEQKRPHMPPMQKEHTYTDLGDGIWNISSPPVGFQQYVVLGKEKAALIDTGMGIGSIRSVVEKITELPVIVINTHGHPDHAGGNAEFEPALINPADLDVFDQMTTLEFRRQDVARMPGGSEWAEKLQPQGPSPIGVPDGHIVDLGGRSLELIYAPGHTHGSMFVYDEQTGTVFTGDNVQPMTTALREWNSSTVEELYESLLKLAQKNITRLLSGHRPNDSKPELLARKIECAREILDGAQGERHEHMGNVTLIHEYAGTSIEYTEQNIRRK